jgi:protoporphyrinogen oxidase
VSSVIVLGGGLTGLVTAEQLGRAGLVAPVIERGDEPGGACRSLEREGFVFDHTAHLLHVSQPRVRAYLEELGLFSELAVHRRRAAVVVGGRTTPYPIQIHTHGLAPEVRRDCLLGFIRAWAGADPGGESCFRDWVLRRFGDGLARHFFFPYNRKLYRTEPEELTVDWVGRYVPRPRLEEVVDGALGLHQGDVGYNATFRYPERGGIRLLPDTIARGVDDLRLGQEAVAIHLAERWLEIAGGGRVPYRLMVSTISLPTLLDLVRDRLPEEVAAARLKLRWVRVLNLALGVEGQAPRPEHWLYFPDPALPFYRVGFPSNHGAVAPPGCHTVSVEVSLDPGTGDVEAEALAAEAALVGAGLLQPERVRVRLVTVLDPAYVVFDRPRRRALATLRRFLAGHQVVIAGRWAEWKYSAMEDAVVDGMRAARMARKADGGR